MMKVSHSGILSKDAVFAMGVATEAFIKALTEAGCEKTTSHKRKILKADDLHEACREEGSMFDFLQLAETSS